MGGIMNNKKDLLMRHLKNVKKLRVFYKKQKEILYFGGLNKKNQIKLLQAQDAIDSIRSFLDDHYHSLITDKEFKKWGHIYYPILPDNKKK
jgi:alpha-amylase/alpha-mannosidase (GH57 family)